MSLATSIHAYCSTTELCQASLSYPYDNLTKLSVQRQKGGVDRFRSRKTEYSRRVNLFDLRQGEDHFPSISTHIICLTWVTL